MGYHLTSSGCEAGVTSRTAYPRSARYEAGLRFFYPGTGRWCSRDPIGEIQGEEATLYAYAFNNPLFWIDPLGLRNVSFVFYNDFLDDELTIAVRGQAERIMSQCFQSCDKCKQHTFSFEWKRVTGEDADMDLGFSGRNIFLRNPTRVGTYVHRATEPAYVGSNPHRWRSWVNPVRVREQAANYDVGMGVAIVHEAIYHGVGFMFDPGSVWRIPNNLAGRYVDDPSPDTSFGALELSPASCKEICDVLDIEMP